MEHWIIALAIVIGSVIISLALYDIRQSYQHRTAVTMQRAEVHAISSIAGYLIGGWLSNPRFDEKLREFMAANKSLLIKDMKPWEVEHELNKIANELTVFERSGRKPFRKLLSFTKVD
jgi:hypothetical protein